MAVGRLNWLLAFGVALAVHLAVIVWVMWQSPPTGAVTAGFGGVEVSLGATGAPSVDEAAEVMPESVTSNAPVVEQAESETETAPVAEEIPLTEETTPAEAPATPAPAALEVQAAEVAEAEPTEVAEAVEIAEPVEERPVEVRRTAPKPVPKPERPVVRREPPPPRPAPVRSAVPTPREPARQQRAAVEPPRRAAPAAAPSPAVQANRTQGDSDQSAQRPAPSGPQGAAAHPAEAGGGGLPGASADYLALLRSWLERHKEYPRRAQLRRQEGTALLYFVMDRQGRVLEYRLRQSSGYPLLDSEVEEMIRRAQPLPAVPDDFGHARLEFVIPVQFRLK